MFRRLYRWFLARFRISMKAVCEESAALGERDDYHDYPDTAEKEPWHFTRLTCERCGKTFYI